MQGKILLALSVGLPSRAHVFIHFSVSKICLPFWDLWALKILVSHLSAAHLFRPLQFDIERDVSQEVTAYHATEEVREMANEDKFSLFPVLLIDQRSERVMHLC